MWVEGDMWVDGPTRLYGHGCSDGRMYGLTGG